MREWAPPTRAVAVAVAVARATSRVMQPRARCPARSSRARRSCRPTVQVLTHSSPAREKAVAAQLDVPWLFAAFEARVAAAREEERRPVVVGADAVSAQAVEEDLWVELERRHDDHVWFSHVGAESTPRGACASAVYEGIALAEREALAQGVSLSSVLDATRRAVHAGENRQRGCRALVENVTTVERHAAAVAHASSKEIAAALGAAFFRDGAFTHGEGLAHRAEEVFASLADPIRVGFRRPPSTRRAVAGRGEDDHVDGDDGDGDDGDDGIVDSDELYRLFDAPDAREARHATTNPVAALRGALANVHTRGSRACVELDNLPDDALTDDEIDRIVARLRDTLEVDETSVEQAARDFAERTSSKQSIVTCATCGARELHQSMHTRHMRGMLFSKEDEAALAAAEHYMIDFPGYRVNVPLLKLLTYSEHGGQKYKIYPAEFSKATEAPRDSKSKKRNVKKGDKHVKICGSCDRLYHMTPAKRKTCTTVSLLSPNSDFGDIVRFTAEFNAQLRRKGKAEWPPAMFEETLVESKVLGLGRLCSHTFKVSAGFDANRQAFKGHTIAFVNRHKTVLEPIRLLQADELADVAHVSIVGCENNINGALERLKGEFTGAITVREQTLYFWYHVLRQLRCRHVVAAKLKEMDERGHASYADALRAGFFKTIPAPDDQSSNAALFDAYQTERSPRDFRRLAKDAMQVLMERVEKDSSAVAQSLEASRDAAVDDVANVRAGDRDGFERTSFVHDSQEEETMSVLDAIVELRKGENRRCGRGSAPLSDFGARNRALALEALFPCQFVIPNSASKIQSSRRASTRLLVVFHDKRFTRDMSLVWHLYDRQRRMEAWKASAIVTTHDKVEELKAILDEPDFDSKLLDWIRMAKEGRTLPAEARALIQQLSTTHTSSMTFTEELRKSSRKKLVDLQRWYGPSVLFWTIAPDDKGSSLMLRLGLSSTTRQQQVLQHEFPDSDDIFVDGERKSFAEECARLEDHAEEGTTLSIKLGVHTKADLLRFAAANPTATSLVFERLVKEFVEAILGISTKHWRATTQRAVARRGLFGVAGAAAYVVETNGRESLHVHGLLYGTDVTPALLRRLAARPEFVSFARDWIDAAFQKHVAPSVSIMACLSRMLNVPINGFNSVSLAAGAVDFDGVNDMRSFGQWVASMCNQHAHCPSCWKNGHVTCRFGMPTNHGPTETYPGTICDAAPPYEQRCQHARKAYEGTDTGLTITCVPEVEPVSRMFGRNADDITGPRSLVDAEIDATVWVQACPLTCDAFDAEDERLRSKRFEADGSASSKPRTRRLEELNTFDRLIEYLKEIEGELNSPNAVALGASPLPGVVDALRQRREGCTANDEQEFFKAFHATVACSNGMLAPYNAIVSSVVGCNTSINFLGSSMASTVATHYLTKYLSKASTELTEILECLKRVVGDRRESQAPDADTDERRIKFTLTRLANAVAAHREVPDTMIVSWALGLDSDYFSTSFTSVYGTENVRRLKRMLAASSSESDDDCDDEGVAVANAALGDDDLRGDAQVAIDPNLFGDAELAGADDALAAVPNVDEARFGVGETTNADADALVDLIGVEVELDEVIDERARDELLEEFGSRVDRDNVQEQDAGDELQAIAQAWESFTWDATSEETDEPELRRAVEPDLRSEPESDSIYSGRPGSDVASLHHVPLEAVFWSEDDRSASGSDAARASDDASMWEPDADEFDESQRSSDSDEQEASEVAEESAGDSYESRDSQRANGRVASVRRRDPLRAAIERTRGVPILADDLEAVVQMRRDGGRVGFASFDNLTDYMARGQALRHMSIVEYLTCVRTVVRSHVDVVERIDANDESGDDDERHDAPNELARKRRAGRARLARFEFDASHPKKDTHTQMLRAKTTVPRWAGRNPVPSIRTAAGEKNVAEWVLVNFVPWQTLDDVEAMLAHPVEAVARLIYEWQSPGSTFVEQARLVLVKNALTAFTISSVERCLHNAWRMRHADKLADADSAMRFSVAAARGSNENALYTREHRLAELTFTSEELVQAVQIRQTEPLATKRDRLQELVREVVNDQSGVEREDAEAREVRAAPAASDLLDSSDHDALAGVVRAVEDKQTRDAGVVEQENVAPDGSGYTLARSSDLDVSVLDDVQLTSDQLAIYSHVCDYLRYVKKVKRREGEFAVSRDKRDVIYNGADGERRSFNFLRVCTFIHGGPGCGKTYLIDAIRRTIADNDLGSTLVVAPSASAAILHAGGKTYHSACSVKKDAGATSYQAFKSGLDKSFATNKADDLQLLVMDEVSMASAKWFAHMDRHLRQWRSTLPDGQHLAQLPFGGLLIICAGDLKQLQPVAGQSIAKAHDSVGDDKIGAKLVWGMARLDVKTQVRARTDAVHTNFIEAARALRQVDRSSFTDLFQSIRPVTGGVDVDSRIITASNSSRHVLNLAMAEKQARRDNTIVVIWNEIVAELERNENELFARTVYAYENAVGHHLIAGYIQDGPGLLEKNWVVDKGVVNGLVVYMRRLVYENEEVRRLVHAQIQAAIESVDEHGRRNVFTVHVSHAPDGMIVDVTDSVVDSGAWPPNATLEEGRVVLPIMRKFKREIKYKSNFAKTRLRLERANVSTCGVTLAYAITAWKAQGQTFKDVNVVLWLPPSLVADDITRCGGRLEALYVVVTRVGRASQMRYLPWDSVVSGLPWYDRWRHALGLEFDEITDAFLRSYVPAPSVDETLAPVLVFDETRYLNLVATIVEEQEKKIDLKSLRYKQAKLLATRTT